MQIALMMNTLFRGLSETEIEQKITSKRAELRKRVDEGKELDAAEEQINSHSEALRMEARNAKLADALDIRSRRSRSRSRSPRRRDRSTSSDR